MTHCVPKDLNRLSDLNLSNDRVHFRNGALLTLIRGTRALPRRTLPRPVLGLVSVPNCHGTFGTVGSLVASIDRARGVDTRLLTSHQRVGRLLG